MDLEAVWEFREEVIYRQLFGPLSRGIFPLTVETFAILPDARIDPRWLNCGVFEYGPNDQRRSWLYVTSGYSNPWDMPPDKYVSAAPSGSGVEFSIETGEAADWAVGFLQRMLAFDMLLATGQFGDKPPLSLHDRVPLGGPIDGREGSPVTNAILHEPESYAAGFDLPSGKVEILQFLGVCDEEIEIAREEGFYVLREKLRAIQAFPVTRTDRD